MTTYVVAMCGDLNRGERMNCAVLAWDPKFGDTAPVTVCMLEDWTRIDTAFFGHLQSSARDDLHTNIIERLKAIKTFGDFRAVCGKMGPYTPFEFTEGRGSIEDPETTAKHCAEYFLRLKKESRDE